MPGTSLCCVRVGNADHARNRGNMYGYLIHTAPYCFSVPLPDRRSGIFYGKKGRDNMDYPVIDPVATGSNIRTLIKASGNTIAGVGRMLGIADMSTVYKWLRGDALPGIDNMLALSMILHVSINDMLATQNVN